MNDVFFTSDVPGAILVPSGNGDTVTAKMEFVAKLKTFASDLKSKLLPYVFHIISVVHLYICGLFCVQRSTVNKTENRQRRKTAKK